MSRHAESPFLAPATAHFGKVLLGCLGSFEHYDEERMGHL